MARLPDLTSLRALEAAVRLKSYSAAARELNLTHGAISQRLRGLEQDLGVALFRRVGNAMVGTPAAQILACAGRKAVDQLSAAVKAAGEAAGGEPLVVSLNAQFANRWLAPRLERLSAAGLNLTFVVEDRLADLGPDGVDVALRHGAGGWPGVEQVLLAPESLFPVCSPDFARRHRLAGAADLAAAPLLRHISLTWDEWFAAAGLPTPPAEGLAFDDSGLLLEAAARGLGVALARSTLVADDLRAGRLVRAAPGEAPRPGGVFMLWRADNPKLARIATFRSWLEAETAALAA